MLTLYFCCPPTSKGALHIQDDYCNISKDNGSIVVVPRTPLVPSRTEKQAVHSNVPSILRNLPVSVPFLSCQSEEHLGKKTLVLDLDETLVHSSFDPSQPHQFSVPLILDGRTCEVYVSVRPGIDSFLQSMSSLYEIVVFTASSHQVGLHSFFHCVVRRQRIESFGFM